MVKALEHIRRMRGGAQAHLMRCSDGNYYVVKFQNNPQHRRFLVNERLGTPPAGRMRPPTAPVSVVEVPQDLPDPGTLRRNSAYAHPLSRRAAIRLASSRG